MRPPGPRKAAQDLGLKYFFAVKPCKNGHTSERYTKNRACVACNLAARVVYSIENPEKIVAYNLKRRGNLVSKMACKAWRERNSDWVSQRYKNWAAKNRDKIRAIQNNRLARKRGNGGSHTAADIQEIFSLQKKKCAICRTDLRNCKYHVDHIEPLARGGSNDRKNLQILCVPCNLSKQARDPIEFMQSQGALL